MDDSDRDASSSANESDDEPKASSRSSSRSNSESGGGASSGESQKSPAPQNDANGKSPENSGDEGDGSESDASNRSAASSRGSRSAHKNANLEDGNSSDSSESSVDSSSRKNKDYAKNVDTQPEEISDGDIESDNEKADEAEKKPTAAVESSLAHDADDLSDVSDLDESIGGHSEPERPDDRPDTPKGGSDDERSQKVTDKTHRPEEGEEQLDFEAEDGECGNGDTEKDGKEEKTNEGGGNNKEENKDGVDKARKDKEEPEEGEELEEGEVTDEDEARPEETEPRPVCRFFSRGQCTWGASCRFLHPGVTDKGNYTMFEMIRPVVPGEYGRGDDRSMYGRPEQPLVESAWERGLRTAKEMLRKSIKRKEQDIDFEEKKMNLSLAQEELDKENGYYARVPSPEPRYVRHPVPVEYAMSRVPPEEYYGRRQVLYEPEYAPRDRRPMYREMPPHRPQPDYHYEEEMPKARRPKREVIVQRAVEERPTRGDEWSDPWMRSKSPGARKGAGKRSYSSGSSYSSSSSSRSSSRSSRSSYRSRSRSPRHRRSSRGARGGGAGPGGPSGRGRHGVSPSVIVSERKAASERAALMNPPAPRKKAPSPGMMRAGAQNPPAPSSRMDGRTRKLAVAAALARVKSRRRSSRSSSGSSSGSSSSDSDSSSSSSSSREASPPRRAPGVDLALAMKVKAIDALKVGAEKRPIKLTLKTPVGRKVEPAQGKTTPNEPSPIGGGKKRPATSPPPTDKAKKAAGNGSSGTGSGATSRREELLKQLKAVEDAIAKKRSKVN